MSSSVVWSELFLQLQDSGLARQWSRSSLTLGSHLLIVIGVTDTKTRTSVEVVESKFRGDAYHNVRMRFH